jgi:hypothetical protein
VLFGGGTRGVRGEREERQGSGVVKSGVLEVRERWADGLMGRWEGR